MQQLADTFSGALMRAHKATILFYPIGASAWDFLTKGHSEFPAGASLGFSLFNALPISLLDQIDLNADDLWEWLGNHHALRDRLKSNPASDPQHNKLNVLFRDMFEIDYHSLVGTKNQPNFFLAFLPCGGDFGKEDERSQEILAQTSEEHDLVYDFLRFNGAEVYSTQEYGTGKPDLTGQYEYFRQ